MERHFAALSLPDPSSDPKITRAISFSELPTSRRILIEQCYQSDNKGTLVKQYSCEQIFDKLSSSREVKVSEVVRTGSEHCLCNNWTTNLPAFDNAGWHNGQFGKSIRAIEPRKTQKMESMEVEEIEVKPSVPKMVKSFTKKLPIMELNGMSLSDVNSNDRTLIKASTFATPKVKAGEFAKPIVRSRSASPKNKIDRSILAESKFTEIVKTDETRDNENYNYNESKKKLRSLVPEEHKNSKKSRFSCCTWYKFVFFILLTIAAAIIAIFLHDESATRLKRPHNFDIANMSAELRDRVYGQERAIQELLSELEKRSSGINIVALIGGTGVGKSYTISIVAKYFSPFNYIFEYCSPLRKTIHEAFLSLSRRNCNLVILENLRKTDLSDVGGFVKFMENYTKKLCVYVIIVFNPHETGNDLVRKFDRERSVDEVSSFFQSNDIDYGKIISFDDLNTSSLDACIRKAAEEKNMKLSHEKLQEIRENLISGASGCKGAYAKVQLLIES